MKKLLFILAVYCIVNTSFAQQKTDPSNRFDLRLNAGTTFTFVPDFNNWMLVARGMLVPGFITPDNAISLNSVKASSKSESSVGWHVEAEGYYSLPRNFSLSLGLGIQKMRFDYTSDFVYFKAMNQPVSMNMDDISRRFGKTDLLYLSITPINISKRLLHNRLAIQVGPVINCLLEEKNNSTVVVYNSQEALATSRPDEAYFDSIGNTRKVIYGANLGISYKVVEPVFVKISAQYYVNSMYEDATDFGFFKLDVEKINPFLLQAGVSVAPFAF
jgi:hypothetical protein